MITRQGWHPGDITNTVLVIRAFENLVGVYIHALREPTRCVYSNCFFKGTIMYPKTV